MRADVANEGRVVVEKRCPHATDERNHDGVGANRQRLGEHPRLPARFRHAIDDGAAFVCLGKFALVVGHYGSRLARGRAVRTLRHVQRSPTLQAALDRVTRRCRRS